MNITVYLSLISAIQWATPRIDPNVKAECPAYATTIPYKNHEHNFLVVPHTAPPPWALQSYRAWVWVWVYEDWPGGLFTNSVFDAHWDCEFDDNAALRLIKFHMYGEPTWNQ